MALNQTIKLRKQNLVDLRFDCIKLLFRQTDVGQDLAEKDRQKDRDKHSFGGCVCGYKGMALCLTTNLLQIKQTTKIRVNFSTLSMKIASVDR